MEIVTPNKWVCKTLIELNLRAKYEITILAVKNGDKINVIPSPGEELQENSILVVIGKNSNISAIVTKDKNSK